MSASSASKGAKPAKNSSVSPAKGGTTTAEKKQATPAAKKPQNQSNKGLVRPAPRAKVRRARLVVSKVDTWSVLKLAFLLSVALGIITVVASLVLWLVLNLTGLFDGINEMLSMLGGNAGGTDIKEFLSLGNVALFATIISVVNVILLTALSVLGALLYNIAAALIGGIGVTLTDD
ncbi:hypothetical protein CKW39_05880 [Kocuria sp. WRN011]|uniref:DUF3566 domain-containing protein n=1 Tax=Kocuria carniphila TaxID=262208 RepID=A0ABV3V1S0_9MICC|nr:MULTISPECIES: DUF3566 domain-containing protein [Kocuria]MCT1801859.1 DUF3566 domain-containing protein [Kocuria carniphila]PBB09079.1 hypothetical protein CKW39_05880 [Kocuria sp. WRN011]PZP31465.1 MAG: DUF3566 domain-containing protein [Kocuria rhizophila]